MAIRKSCDTAIAIPRLREMAKKLLAGSVWEDSSQAMIRGSFLTSEERQDLTELARDGTVEHRLARRANALVLLDRGMSCEEGCC
jgi:hypothetical protein